MRARSILDSLTALAVISAAFALPPAAAQAPASPPFAAADAQKGKALHDKDCIACHAERFGGDAAKMYTRPEHRVRTVAQLRAQVAYCNTQLGTSYFPDEEENVAAYLDHQYYHLKP